VLSQVLPEGTNNVRWKPKRRPGAGSRVPVALGRAKARREFPNPGGERTEREEGSRQRISRSKKKRFKDKIEKYEGGTTKNNLGGVGCWKQFQKKGDKNITGNETRPEWVRVLNTDKGGLTGDEKNKKGRRPQKRVNARVSLLGGDSEQRESQTMAVTEGTR